MGDVVRYTSAKRPPADYAFDDDQYDEPAPLVGGLLIGSGLVCFGILIGFALSLSFS